MIPPAVPAGTTVGSQGFQSLAGEGEPLPVVAATTTTATTTTATVGAGATMVAMTYTVVATTYTAVTAAAITAATTATTVPMTSTPVAVASTTVRVTSTSWASTAEDVPRRFKGVQIEQAEKLLESLAAVGVAIETTAGAEGTEELGVGASGRAWERFRSPTIASTVSLASDPRVLPPDQREEGWSNAFTKDLDDSLRHFIRARGGQPAGQPVEFFIVAEEDVTLAPGTVAPFGTVDTPAYSAGRVVFSGRHASSFEGVWEWRDGQLATVVSSADLAFRGLADVSGSMRSFTASGVVYTRNGNGPFVPVADELTPIPGGVGNFQNFSWAATDGVSVVFTIGPINTNATGIYSVPVGGGTVVKIVDLNSGFNSFLKPVTASAGHVAFTAYDAEVDAAVYRAAVNGTGLTTIVDGNTPIPVPNLIGTFFQSTLDLFSPSISGDTVGFYGGGSGIRGIFRKKGAGPLEPVVTSLIRPPGAQDTFSNFYGVSVSGDNVAFIGAGAAGSNIPRGLFVVLNGQLEKVVDFSQTINGRPFREIYLHPKGLDGTSVGFSVFLDDTNNPGLVLARCLDCVAVFSDGFEAGNASRWSGVVP